MPTTLSSRERLLRVFRGQDLDRVPIRLWGVDPFSRAPRPEWQFLHDLVNEKGLDTIAGFNGPAPAPSYEVRHDEQDTADPEWFEHTTTIMAPGGPLTTIWMGNRLGKPGYVKKHLIETLDDAQRWLSLPPAPLPDVSGFQAYVEQVGDRALVLAGMGEAMYTVNDAMGSELWGYWLYDERELVHAMVAKAHAEDMARIRHLLDHGLGPLFGWVGPELCIPPLASPADFDDFVTRYDGPLIDTIHDAGGLVWIHCHGDMDPVLERFVAMGVDCLNPIEPPPIGRLTLADAKRRVAGRMTLEGGIEVGDFELCSAEEVRAKTATAMEMGKPGGRFILCPSSSHDHWPDMPDDIAQNYRVFVETALAMAEY
jgi:uroporphyrinogen-III decarboxylase